MKSNFIYESEKEYRKILQLLNESNKQVITFEGDNYSYYVVTPQTMQELVKMEEEFKKRMEKELGKQIKRPYHLIAKLIAKDEPAIKYSITPIKRYIYIKDKDKIIDRLEGYFNVWKNRKQKEINLYIKENKLTQTEAKELQEKVAQEIVKGYEKMNYIKENKDRLELIRSNYAFAKYYLVIQYKTATSRGYKLEHLRKQVINIISYENITLIKKKRRKDMIIEKFLEEAEYAFEHIYFKEIK